MPLEATSKRTTGSTHPDKLILFPYDIEPRRVWDFRVGPIGELIKRLP
jgi:hypothetical protein